MVSNRNRPRAGSNKAKRPAKRGVRRQKLPPIVSETTVDVADLNIRLDQGTYIIFDIETTGGNPSKNGITEIFALKYQNGSVVDQFYSMVNPQILIPGIVRRMTGITNAMVKDAPLIEAVMPGFIEFIGNDILVSHNTIGDLKFLVYFAREVGHKLSNFFLCTHLLTERLIPEAPNKSLQGLGLFLGAKQGPVHRAKEDSYLTLELFKVLCDRLRASGVEQVVDAIRLQADWDSGVRVGWGIDKASMKQAPSKQGVLTLMDRKGRKIFVSSALNLKRNLELFDALKLESKQLQKLILQSYAFELEVTDHLFGALLREAQLYQSIPAKYEPLQWHSRFVSGICFSREAPDKIKIAISSVTKGAVNFFGPIHDRKQANQLLQSIAEIFDIKYSRRGMVVEQGKADLIELCLFQKMNEWRYEKRKKIFSFKYLLSSQYRKEIQLMEVLGSKLSSLTSEVEGLQVESLLGGDGFVVASVNSVSLDVYPVLSGVPKKPLRIRGPWDVWASSESGREYIHSQVTLMQASVTASENNRPLSGEDAYKVGAVLWVRFQQGKKSNFSEFISLDDIKKSLQTKSIGRFR